jgi:hypothetical protein
MSFSTTASRLSDRPDTPAADSQGTALGLLIVVMLLTIGPLIVLTEIIAYWRVDVVDDQMFGYYGWRIVHGATVYRDIWDNKPPGIYWVNALGMLLGQDSYFGVVGLCAAALVVAHAAFFRAASAVYHRSAAALTTILLSFFFTHAYFTGGTNRTETFLVPCELLAVALYLRGFVRGGAWRWYTAGLLCGTAFIFKQVGLAAWAGMGLHLLWLAVLRELPLRTAVQRGVLLLGGAATTIGLAAAYLAAQGVLQEACYATFTFNRLYFAVGASHFPYNFVTWTLLKEHLHPILLLPLLMALAAAIHALLWWRRPQFRPPEIEATLRAQGPTCPHHFMFFALWFALSVYGALLSPHGFRHYVLPAIPPLLFMAGYLVNVLRAETKLLRRLQQRAWVTVAFVIMGYFSWDALWLQFQEISKIWVFRLDPYLTGTGKFEPAEWETVGDAVARHTQPGDRIQCFGYLPGVYLQARRLNASRYTTTEKFGQIGTPAHFIVDEIETALRNAPPAAIVISHGDYAWMHHADRRARESAFKLGPWLDENYTLAEEVPKFGTIYIFKRKDLVP